MKKVYIITDEDYHALTTLIGMLQDEVKREVDTYNEKQLRKIVKRVQNYSDDLNKIVYRTDF